MEEAAAAGVTVGQGVATVKVHLALGTLPDHLIGKKKDHLHPIPPEDRSPKAPTT